jgi:hypothetical protein
MIMNFDLILVWKSRISRAGALLFCLFLISLADGGVAYLRQPFNGFSVIPGDSVMLTGPMAPGVYAVEGMNFETSSPLVLISIDEVISGFWMGGKMWRGTIVLSPEIAPGSYSVSVFGKEDGKRVRANSFKFIVYKDRETRIASSKSIIQRYSGVSPLVPAGFFLLMGLLASACLYLISGKEDRLRASRGEAEVFLVKTGERGDLIYFGLGRIHGVDIGHELLVMDSTGRSVDRIRVESVSDTDAAAITVVHSEIRPGWIVKRIDPCHNVR